MRSVRILAFAALAASSATVASATPIISGNGELWTSSFSAVCAQVGGGTPCGGTTVAVNQHPHWQNDTVTNPLAQWVSYADTGYLGSVLAPANGSAANPTGQAVIMEITESFVGTAGSAVAVRFWADDTMSVYFNNVLMKAASFSQDTCSAVPIGCETNEYWDLLTTATGGTDVLRMVAFQVGNGNDTVSNPFGVLYSGSYAAGSDVTVPEPMTMSLLGLGLAGLAFKRARSRQ